MFNKYNKIFQENRFTRLFVLLAFSFMVSACGGGSGDISEDPADDVNNLFPDCTSGNANYSGCWISEACDFEPSTPNLSSYTLYRYKEQTVDPVTIGVAEVFGAVYENETCSGSPSLVSNVGFLESYAQKDDVACVDTGGTVLYPNCTNLELQFIHENGTVVSGIDPVDLHFYIINDTRLCRPSDNNLNTIDLTNGACFMKVTP
jgi:hypothetical protein